MSEFGPTVVADYCVIRDSGATNMMDRGRVEQIALQNEMYDLAAVCADADEYMKLLMSF
jgi:hypothetical protein